MRSASAVVSMVGHKLNVIRTFNRVPAQALASFAVGMSSQAEGSTVISMRGEIGQEVFVPAPGAVPLTLYNK